MKKLVSLVGVPPRLKILDSRNPMSELYQFRLRRQVISEETAVPCPYARLMVGTRHCRLLICGNINPGCIGINITRLPSSIVINPANSSLYPPCYLRVKQLH